MTSQFDIKAGQPLPDEHSVVRFCPPKFVERDPETEKVLGIFPAAWNLRPGEDYLSVNWLEFYNQGFDGDAVSACVEQFKKNLSVRKSSAFAICNVHTLKTVCASRDCYIKVVLMPEENNLSHSAIKKIKADDEDLFAEISFRAVKVVVDNKEL